MKTFSRTVSFLFATLVLTACSSLSGLVEKPGLSVADFNLVDANIFQQTFRIRLKVDNPNSFALPIVGMNYGLNIMGVDVADGTTANGVRVPANGTDYLEIDLSTNLMKSLPDLSEILKSGGRDLSYNFKGNVKLDNTFIKNVPFNKSGSFNLNF
jgi:LEA14-like dessication related protein